MNPSIHDVGVLAFLHIHIPIMNAFLPTSFLIFFYTKHHKLLLAYEGQHTSLSCYLHMLKW